MVWRPRAILASALAAVLALIVLATIFGDRSQFEILLDPERLSAMIDRLGWLGPIAVVVLIAGAVVFSPLPSAPVAIASGALYGHIWGTLWVILGAEIGAVVAFFLARTLGYNFVRRWLGDRIKFDIGASQNVLTVIVFGSRLIPFLSFDLVSYAAGLTPLKPWRFALATLAGIVPMSFLLAHFGGEFASLSSRRVALAAFALGIVTGLPIAIRLFWRWRARRAGSAGKPGPRR